jgi:hypothetical protein
MTKTPDCSPLFNNSHVVCDTKMAIDSFPSGQYFSVRLKEQAGRCWWDGGFTR